MSKRILITGGAGFIGSHLSDRLLQCGHRVRVLDPLSPQVHGPDAHRPAYLSPDVELIRGSVEDPESTADALVGVDAVFHLASKVGLGQSVYDIDGYISSHGTGTGVLLEALLKQSVERLLVASTMSIYGEGLYRNVHGALVSGGMRSAAQLHAGKWELLDADDLPLTPEPTPETEHPGIGSASALAKLEHERMCLLVGRAHGIPTVALRFFNVYGPRQSLSNPYTGVLAIFAQQFMANVRPTIFEDGLQRRDFVNVRDIAHACCLALEAPGAPGGAFNIGSSENYSVGQIAVRLASILGTRIEPDVTQRHRAGDVRHCFADISRARDVLGYIPRVRLEDGLADFAEWLESQTIVGRFGHPSQ